MYTIENNKVVSYERTEKYHWNWYIYRFIEEIGNYEYVFHAPFYYKNIGDCKIAVNKFLLNNKELTKNCEVVFQEWAYNSDVYDDSNYIIYRDNKIYESHDSCIVENDVMLYDAKLFEDELEHQYNVNCYDGYATAISVRRYENEPTELELEYPRIRTLTREQKKHIRYYRGLSETDSIHYGDVMIVYGQIIE